jgi:hypothetical protein
MMALPEDPLIYPCTEDRPIVRDKEWHLLKYHDASNGVDQFDGVYFVRWGRFIKIGTAYDVVKRARALHGSFPVGTVKPLAWIPRRFTRYTKEHDLHVELAPYCARGEWFHDCPEVRAVIARDGQRWPK